MVLSGQSDAITFPPSDLWSNEPPLESDRHLRQILLLLSSLEWWWRDRPDALEQRRNNFFAAGNLSIYYSTRQRKSEDFRGSDFFVVLDTEYKERKSWMVWEEDGKYPNLILEILSYTTAQIARGLKKQIYQEIFRTPDYFWFEPDTLELAGFSLVSGQYQPLEPNPQGLLWSQQLGLYLGIYQEKLRFFTSDGQLVATPEEDAEIQTQRVQALTAKLQELSVNPDEI